MTKHKDKRTLDRILIKCYNYIEQNYHKFTKTEKIRVALELIKKQMGDSQPKEGDVYNIYNDFRTKARDLGADGIRHLMRNIRAGAGKG